MKQTNFPAILSTTMICYLFWLMLTGQITAIFTGGVSVQVLIAGAIVSILTALFSARFFIHHQSWYLLHPARLVNLLMYCIIIFPIELIKANIDVAVRALRPTLPQNAGIVKIPTEMESEYGLSMLANSITLTPGTITLDVVEQDEKNYMYIHWIDVQEEESEAAGDAIKGTLEKWIRRIWK